MMPKPIAYYFTMLTVQMTVNGVLHPQIIRVESPEKAREKALNSALEDSEGSFGCMTVFDDGSLSTQIFTTAELEL